MMEGGGSFRRWVRCEVCVAFELEVCSEGRFSEKLEGSVVWMARRRGSWIVTREGTWVVSSQAPVVLDVLGVSYLI